MVHVNYALYLAMIGFGVLAAAIAPAVSQRIRLKLPLSVPIACLAGGIVIGAATRGARIDVIGDGVVIEHVTEIAVILSLTGCGLKLDRAIGFRSWGSVWRLLGITMPLSIAAMAILGWGLAGLPAAAALLFGAAMAPTDPVLAASVQVGPPGEGQEEEETRFALTAEAGLNDGLAFPFVHLALAAAAAYAGSSTAPGDPGRFSEFVLSEWLVADVAWRIVAGVGMGVLLGWLLGWLVFRLAPPAKVADAFLAFGLTLFVYGLTEVAHGYGFLAAFVAALTFRRAEHSHQFHTELHHFVEQTEVLLLIGVMFAVGIVIGQGLLASLGWREVLVAVLALVVVRPLAGWIGLAGSAIEPDQRFAMSALGIRGVGSFYYLAYGLSHSPFSLEVGRQLWALAVLIVALSVVLHGLSAPHLMGRLHAGTRGIGARVGRAARRRH